ncbi:Protein of unknown function [Lactobacillus helveticus CIRM-BIA 951]|uniref:Uncharacterized protein n=1 Tax=Lactobacillus helveticus CIRM-BIA 951 TaxID=1226334 RepID=U6F563_LACHE|nr:Protein of unknown function [Lactobacillus helveticus CIRM-BIA 951]
MRIRNLTQVPIILVLAALTRIRIRIRIKISNQVLLHLHPATRMPILNLVLQVVENNRAANLVNLLAARNHQAPRVQMILVMNNCCRLMKLL